jgi:hypothetical protein
MTPAEIAETAKFYFKRKAEEEKTQWKQTRWLAMWIVNVSGKSVKRNIKETELGIRFVGEIVIVDPEERRRQAMETALLHAKMSPQQIKRDKDGKPMIYGENN